jgi:WhiB family transcriptional regulator, redox-sensing transcriptional regulator
MSELDVIARDRAEATWMAQAACRGVDPDLFYPLGQGAPANRAYHKARAICAACPVAGACLDYALALPAQFGEGANVGIWAGTSPQQRRDIRAARSVVEIDAPLPTNQPARLERAAIKALTGVGGDIEWWTCPRGIGHLRVPVTLDEAELIPPGCVTADAGDTGPQRPRTR